jgi:hypothetical protein
MLEFGGLFVMSSILRFLPSTNTNRLFGLIVVYYFVGLPALMLLSRFWKENTFRKIWKQEHPKNDLPQGR